MSTDWDVVCDKCKVKRHMGQRFTGGPALAYGTNDAEGRLLIAKFICRHVGCSSGGMRVILSDTLAGDVADDYRSLDADEDDPTPDGS